MDRLEAHVDELFENNKILEMPFLHIFNHLCEIAMRNVLDSTGTLHEIVVPYTFIFEKLSDFSAQSRRQCNEAFYGIDREKFRLLYACANLNLVFPFVHSGVYSFLRVNEAESRIDYTDDHSLDSELKDIILTELSLPMLRNIKTDLNSILGSVTRRLRYRKSIQPCCYETYIQNMFNLFGDPFEEADIVPEEFYLQIGFSSLLAFKNIRAALIFLCRTYIDIAYIVDKYIDVNNMDGTPDGNVAWEGLAMAKLSSVEMKRLICKISDASELDYEKFCEFYFCDKDGLTGLSSRFMPPFWIVEGHIYFSPAIAMIMLSTRNLLISIQNDRSKNRKYQYDKMISHYFEPALLRRAQHEFSSASYIARCERIYNGGEVDLIIYCKKSHTIMSVQAKATLYPESARMVRRLDDRVKEGVEQILRFDSLGEASRTSFFRNVFPEVEDLRSVKHLRAILTNSGFGSKFSWELLGQYDIIPLNTKVIAEVLPGCSSLLDLSDAVKDYIEELKERAVVLESEKVFELPGHTIRQRHVEFDDLTSVRL